MTLSTLYDMARDLGYSDKVITYAITLSKNVVGSHSRIKERCLFVSSLWISAKEHGEDKMMTARKMIKTFELDEKIFYRYMAQIRNANDIKCEQ